MSLLGINTTQFQALYHFTVGRPLTDDRITTLPAYPGRQEAAASTGASAMRQRTPIPVHRGR